MGHIPFSPDREQKDSLHHPVSKETLWKYFIRELQLDRIMEGNTEITPLSTSGSQNTCGTAATKWRHKTIPLESRWKAFLGGGGGANSFQLEAVKSRLSKKNGSSKNSKNKSRVNTFIQRELIFNETYLVPNRPVLLPTVEEDVLMLSDTVSTQICVVSSTALRSVGTRMCLSSLFVARLIRRRSRCELQVCRCGEPPGSTSL